MPRGSGSVSACGLVNVAVPPAPARLASDLLVRLVGGDPAQIEAEARRVVRFPGGERRIAVGGAARDIVLAILQVQVEMLLLRPAVAGPVPLVEQHAAAADDAAARIRRSEGESIARAVGGEVRDGSSGVGQRRGDDEHGNEAQRP